ncbi:hypothetical protein ACKS0A_07770 [Histoplasma ohiense]
MTGAGGSSETLIAGTTLPGGGVTSTAGSFMDPTRLFRGESLGELLCDLILQDGSKLTIGRPGRSLTTVGIGSLLLRSLSRMLVAARISSPRISLPSLVCGVSSPFGLLVAVGEGDGFSV